MKLTKKTLSVQVVFLLIITALLPVPGVRGREKPDPKLWEKAKNIHREAIVVDTHTDTPMALIEEKLDLGQEVSGAYKNDLDFPRMKKGGLDAVFFAIFVSNQLDKKHPAKNVLEMIDEIYNQVEKYPQWVELAYSPQDIRTLHQKGKSAVLMGLENGGGIENSMRLLRVYYRLGVRYITLTHNNHNDLCDSSTGGEPQWKGLSPLGKEVVREMNRLGMIIDVSHISDQAFWDVLQESRAPVMASHSSVRALCQVPRNLSDDMIKALSQKGGVIQLNFYSSFLDEEYKKKADEVWNQLKPETEKIDLTYKNNRAGYWKAVGELWKQHSPPPPGIEVLINHIDYVVRLVGVDYVGLGSDYDGAGSFPQGLEDVTGYSLITYHLLERGYSEADIKKILGGNFLRVFEGVVETAKGSAARIP